MNEQELAQQIANKFKASIGKEFNFLLIGRTGVGKSSTINSLLGREVAPVGDYEATTIDVKKYTSNFNGVIVNVVDTPGLCDDLETQGKDYHYLELIRTKSPNKIDSVLFVTRLDDTRVSSDEKRGIKLIGESLGSKIWENSVIVFTFAGNSPSNFELVHSKRAELIRSEIGKYANSSIASNIPSVAVDNKSSTKVLPDGTSWLPQFYVTVFERSNNATAFFISTVDRIRKPGEAQKSTNDIPLSDAEMKRIEKAVLTEATWTGIGTNSGALIGGVVGGPIGIIVGTAIGGTIGYAIGSFFNWCRK